MALAADGTLNTKKIQKEMAVALEEDVKYHKTDEMKKRAIKTAKSYDEFKGLVACACLKPVSRQDIDSLSKAKKGWTSTVTSSSAGRAKGGSTGAHKPAAAAGRSLGPTQGGKAVRSSLEFERDWRRIEGGAEQPGRRYSYLRDVGASALLSLFRCEMDAGLMGEVIDTLHHRVCCTQAPTDQGQQPHELQEEEGEGKPAAERRQVAEEAWGLLSCLPRTGRFALNFKFLSSGQRARAAELVSTLTEQLQAEGGRLSEEEMRALVEAFGTVIQ